MRPVLIILLITGALAQAKEPPRPVPHQSLPTPVGAPLEKRPKKVKPEDVRRLELLQCRKDGEDLRVRVIQLEQRLLEYDQAKRLAEQKEVADRYMIDETTTIDRDGNIGTVERKPR